MPIIYDQDKIMSPEPGIVSESESNLSSEIPDDGLNEQGINSNDPNVLVHRQRKFILTKYTIYVTNQRMYIVGSNSRESVFRILEIDLTNTEKLVVMEDNVYFTRNEIMEVLNGIEDSSEGGLTKKITAVGLLGFIKFTKHYYLLVITKRKKVADIGGHKILHIEDTQMIPVANNPKPPERNSVEARYIQIFLNIDLNNTFYYSYSYDLTNTLQTNMIRNKRQSLGLNGKTEPSKVFEFNERFMWNKALLDPISQSFDKVYDWFQPIIHGFIDQVKISIFTMHFYIALIARRSHRFAGARFFKRGVNDNGDVANEVETEQIVSDMLTSSFHDPIAGFYNNPRFTSFVQHRGSIPLSWSQETAPNIRMTKPPIELNIIDPFYSKSALHFNNLFERYGKPVQVLNLIKQREKTPRETKLLDAFSDCIEYLNQFLPEDKKLDYTAWDMSRASKSRSQDVIKWLEKYSEETLNKTGFFQNGETLLDTKLQQGICRTNCVDCLDRTNSAQFVIGKRALGYQLHALGFIKEKYLEYDSDVTNILTEMFHDHGDTIALQYGGSHLVNTLQTYRKINQWSSHSRDIIESVKRFYSNSFMDAQRQEAINLFLGNYVYSPLEPMLWDLNTDYYLHNKKNVSEINGCISYTYWFNDKFLIDQKEYEDEQWRSIQSNKYIQSLQERKLLTLKIEPYTGCFANYWNIKYGSRNYVNLNEIFEFTMNSTRKYFANEQKAIKAIKSSKNEKINSGFNLLSLFKPKDGKKPSDISSSHIRFNSFSERLRGNSSPIKIYDPENQQGDYFSPFKSRKPHRELKLIYESKGDEEAIIEEDVNDSNSTYIKFANIIGYDIDDKEEYTESVQNQHKEFLFSLSQLNKATKNQQMNDEQFQETDNVLNNLTEMNDRALPVVGIDDYSQLDNTFKDISNNASNEDTDMNNFEIQKMLTDVAEKYGLVIPVVSDSTIEFYDTSVDMSLGIPIVGLSEYTSKESVYSEYEEKKKTTNKIQNKLNSLIKEYKTLADPMIDLGDLDKYAQQSRLMQNDLSEESACYDNNSYTEVLSDFSENKSRRMSVPLIPPISDISVITNGDYYSFKKLKNKNSKYSLRDI